MGLGDYPKLLESLRFARAMGFERLWVLSDSNDLGFLMPPYLKSEWKEDVLEPPKNFSEKYPNISVDSLITARTTTELTMFDKHPNLHPFALHHTLYSDLPVIKSHLKVWLNLWKRREYDINLLAKKYHIHYTDKEPYLLRFIESYGDIMAEMELKDAECFQERNSFLTEYVPEALRD